MVEHSPEVKQADSQSQGVSQGVSQSCFTIICLSAYLALVVPDIDVRVHESLVHVYPLVRVDHQHLAQQVPSLFEHCPSLIMIMISRF